LERGFLIGPSSILQNADLSNLDLSGRNLKWASIGNSSLQGTNLEGADLSKANFFGTDFTNSRLKNATVPCNSAKSIVGIPTNLPSCWVMQNGEVANRLPVKLKTPPTIARIGSGGISWLDELQVSGGAWEGVPAPTYKYQWIYCASQIRKTSNKLPPGCKPIYKETGQELTLLKRFLGGYIAAKVTAQNSKSSSIVTYTKSTEIIK
jgi:hypothetical protein